MAVTHYEGLDVWQKAMDLVDAVYYATASFPSQERYGLTSQINRSAVSIPSNIAEGSARHSTKDFLRFLSITLGSLAELDTQLRIAVRQNYIANEGYAELQTLLFEIGRMTRGLQKSLQTKLVTSHQPLVTTEPEHA
jgi:four helix bundle protein